MESCDFFRKKADEKPQEQPAQQSQAQPEDPNHYLIDVLKVKLEEMGYQVEKSGQYIALTVNSELEIATAIIESPNYHPFIMHLMVVTINKTYFPNGITENIVGLGETIEQKVESVLSNYLDTTFMPIITSFDDTHNSTLDFTVNNGTSEVLWHPKPGSLGYQGKWEKTYEGEPLLDLLKDELRAKLTTDKFYWLKIYISRQADGTISGECLFNNEKWDEGMAIVARFAESWPSTDGFVGLKQFIMFRRCDKFD